MPTQPMYRAARAVVFATVCVALAVTGHMVASHSVVPPVAAGAGLVIMTGAGIALGGAERSLATIVGGLLGGQFMLHALFSAGEHGQHLAHSHSMAPSSGGGAMTFAHVAAAVVSAWWLRRGERAVWRLARRVAAAVLRPARALLTPPLPVAAAPRHRAGPARESAPREALLRHVVVRRGPPAASWAALAD
jgi:hypothetical protein